VLLARVAGPVGRERRAVAPSADALRKLHGEQTIAQFLGSSSAPPLAT
jgi:hypothetical protein